MRVVTINGSYRKDGVTDQVLREITRELEDEGACVESVVLRDEPIEFCLNCRECTQRDGCNPGQCVLADGMAGTGIVEKIERANAVVLASPTNMGTVTALFKRFMERLTVYAYWPWGARGPVYRKAKGRQKPAVIISSSSAPAWMARPAFNSLRQLKWSAKAVGAKPVASVCIGTVTDKPKPSLSQRDWRKVKKSVRKLLH